MQIKFISYQEIDQARHLQDYDLETMEDMVSFKIVTCVPCTVNEKDGYLVSNNC